MVDKSSQRLVPVSEQAPAWDAWNFQVARDAQKLTAPSRRQAERLVERLDGLGRHDLEMIDIGCGTGWICDRIIKFGRVTGIDLAPASIERARQRLPAGRFLLGDVSIAALELSSFDVVASLEVLSHVADQAAFMARIAELLKPGGRVYIATQNKPVLERWSAIHEPIPGTIRRWVDHRQLRALLEPHFADIEIESVHPVGDEGLLRLVNSFKLNRVLEVFVAREKIERVKERLMLGHSLIAWARRR